MKKSPEQMKKELWSMGMLAIALLFIALARGMNGDFDIKFTIASTGSVVCGWLFFFYLIGYDKAINKDKKK